MVEVRCGSDVEWFRNEIGIQMYVSECPQLVGILEAFKTNDKFYMFLPYMKGMLTDFVQGWYRNYTEDVARYILH